MATTLFQPKCSCAGQTQDRHSHTYAGGLQTFIGVPTSSVQGCNEPGQGARGDVEQTFSAVPFVSAPVSNGLGGGAKMLRPRAYPYQHVKQTHASYRADSFAALSHAFKSQTQTKACCTPGITSCPCCTSGSKAINSWALCLSVPIPKDLPGATLESVEYTVRYASHDAGSANIHADVVLAHGVKVNEGIVVDYSQAPIYNLENVQPGGEYKLLTVNEAIATRVASMPGFKNAGEGWSHYLDHQKVFPNMKVEEKDGCQLYFFVHVDESTGGNAQRNLTADVLATWNDGDELRQAKEDREFEIREMRKEREQLVLTKHSVEEAIKNLQENERKANNESQKRIKAEEEKIRQLEEKERAAQAEHEKRKQEQEDRKRAFEEAGRKEEEAHAHRMKEVEARLRELAQAEERARRAQEEADRRAREAAIANAPAVADEKMQQQIAEIAKKLNKQCPQGFAWNKVEGGYKCGGGGHFLTFAELGMA